MGARGKKSKNDLRLINTRETRPNPPKHLTKEQAAEWRAVVNCMPADWFPRETHQLLSQYCRHVVTAQKIGDMINDKSQSDDVDPVEYERLLKMHDREGRAMSSLATRMRISQQATYDKVKSKKSSSDSKKPWE